MKDTFGFGFGTTHVKTRWEIVLLAVCAKGETRVA